MKILYITVRSDFGGGPRHVDQLVENMPEDIEIYMAYPKDGDPYGIKWADDKRLKGYCEIPYRKLSLSALFRLRTFVKKNNIKIVHSHGQGAGMYSRLLKIICSEIVVVHTFHGIASSYTSKLKALMSKVTNMLFSPLTEKFICVSEGEKAMAIEKGYCKRHNAHVIYNGVEPSKKYETQKNKCTKIVTLSRFDYQKNMDFAYEIASAFKCNKKLQFVWVGDGEDMLRLKQKSEEEGCNILFSGFSTEPSKYLQSSDIYLSTSRFEGLPYALVEACESGLPIVATNVVGNNEVCIDGENGILFNTTKEAVAAIQSLLDDKELMKMYSEGSKRIFEDRFTIEKMTGKLYEIYKSLSNK